MKARVSFNAKRVNQLMQLAGKKGLYKAAHHVAKLSKDEVPLDKRPLMDSQVVDIDEAGHEAVVSYDTPYARRWHEEDANFQRGRKKKYLEDPINDPAAHDALQNCLAAEYKEALK